MSNLAGSGDLSVHYANIFIICLSTATVVGGLLAATARHIGKQTRLVANDVVTTQLSVFKTAVDARFDTNDADSRLAAEKATSLEIELARQFGGNGNGIRQALDKQSADLATLNGRFDEHVRRNSDG